MPVPTAKDVFAFLEGYNVEAQISEIWIVSARDSFVIPWLTGKLKMSYQGIQQATEYYSGDGGSILVLRRRPIVDLLQVSYTNVVANQYFISPLSIQIINEEGILKAKANFNEANYTPVFARGERNLRVTYTYGGTDYPVDVARMIVLACADRVLAHIGSRTGGGALSVQSYSRQYGSRGKYTDIRNDIARELMSILKPRLTGVTQA